MEPRSRSALKRQHRQVEAAAAELCRLSGSERRQLALDAPLEEAVDLGARLKGGALKRQIKYVARLLKEEEAVEAVLAGLAELRGSKLRENVFLHEIERLRDEIVNEALAAFDASRQSGARWELDWQSPTLEAVAARYPGLDCDELRRSAHAYARSRNKTHYRELFRMIRAAAEKRERSTPAR